jgi:hypothetical protein
LRTHLSSKFSTTGRIFETAIAATGLVCLVRKRFTTEGAEDTEAEMKNPQRQECVYHTAR